MTVIFQEFFTLINRNQYDGNDFTVYLNSKADDNGSYLNNNNQIIKLLLHIWSNWRGSCLDISVPTNSKSNTILFKNCIDLPGNKRDLFKNLYMSILII